VEITLQTAYCNLPLSFQVPAGNSRTLAIIFGSGRCSSKKSRQPLCSNWFAFWDHGLKFCFTKWWLSNPQSKFPRLGNGMSPVPTIEWSIWSCNLFITGSYSVSKTASRKRRTSEGPLGSQQNYLAANLVRPFRLWMLRDFHEFFLVTSGLKEY